MDESKAENLARALAAWIDYQVLCGRKDLLSEMYLGIPIGEFLLSKSTWKLKSEREHPLFRTTKKGRPRQTDYVVLSRDKERPICALELKWIDKNPNRQNVINDILRLDCWHSVDGQSMNRFLIMVSLDENFENFKDLEFNNKNGKRINFYKELFPAKGLKMQLDIKNCKHRGLKEFYKEFYDTYETELPSSLQIKCIGFFDSEYPKRTVVIWRISNSKKRSTFKPDPEWLKN